MGLTYSQPLPAWAEEIRRKYVRNEAIMFVLHSNVFDTFYVDKEPYTLIDFLTKVMLKENKRNVLIWDPSSGIHFTKKTTAKGDMDKLSTKRQPLEVLTYLEDTLLTTNGTAIVTPYVSMIAPDAPMNFLNPQDRLTVTTLHRWSLNPHMNSKDNIVFLISEKLSEVSSTLISNPRVAVVDIPLPSLEERRSLVRQLDKNLDAAQCLRLAEQTAGLKSIQISSILTPSDDEGMDDRERRQFIVSLLGSSTDAGERADKLAAMTRGMDRDEIRHLINPEKLPSEDERKEDPLAEVIALINTRKRELIEKECQGLIEFIDDRHDFTVVGGKQAVKQELLQIADNIKAGNKTRVPMGLLFVGPMGTGKTFIAGAFAKEAGITAVKLKNFRSKWVGETESNLEKVLTIIQAMGPVMLVIDEGDRSFGSSEGDDGTSSRSMARLKEFMSDTENRGNVLFVVMTNRPDKLDTDLKRAGRLDRKIPFFYPADEEEVRSVLQAQFRRYRLDAEVNWEKDMMSLCSPLIGYSIADIEAVVLLANNIGHERKRKVDVELFQEAVHEYLPSRDMDMLHYMELLAVFESSSRSMLPKKYQSVTAEELNQRLREMQGKLGVR